MNYPWFRFYPEALDDLKMIRVARAADVQKVIVLGVWVGLLSLASDSPERGRLLISINLPLVTDEMADKIGIDLPTLEKVINALVSLDMLQWNENVLVVTHWDTRQPLSDHSRERVRKHREKAVCDSNDGVTDDECYSNSTEKDKDVELETEEEEDKKLLSASAAPPPPFDPSEMTISEIKRQKLTVPEWKLVQESEKTGKKRRGALEFMRRQINPPHPAIQAYRAIAETTPKRAICEQIIEKVGEAEPDIVFWKDVVKGWIGMGWKEYNITGMLDFYGRREIPSNNNHAKKKQSAPPGSAANEWLRQRQEAGIG